MDYYVSGRGVVMTKRVFTGWTYPCDGSPVEWDNGSLETDWLCPVHKTKKALLEDSSRCGCFSRLCKPVKVHVTVEWDEGKPDGN